MTNSGQKGADGQCGAINVPLARDLTMKMRTLDKIGIGGTSRQFMPRQSWKNASTPDVAGFQNLEKYFGTSNGGCVK